MLENRGPGRGFAVEVRSLEHTTIDYEEDGTGSRLVAVQDWNKTGVVEVLAACSHRTSAPSSAE